MPKVKAEIIISGDVQGVGFRASTYQKVREFDLKGKVWNRPDGKVGGVFEGEKEKVDEVIRWCQRGPSTANVNNVEPDISEIEE